MEIGPLLIGVGVAAVFLAGIVRGLTGFGFALVAVPVLSILISPKIVIPLVVLQMFLTNAPLLVRVRKDVRLGHFWPLIAGAVAGIPFGALVLLLLEEDALRLLIGGVVTVFGVLLMVGVGRRMNRERLAFLPVGFVSGVLNGSSSLSGPPVALFFANQEMSPRVFRANIVMFLSTTNLTTVAAFLAGGLFTREVLVLTLVFLPAVAVGTTVGDHFAGRVEPGMFRVVTLMVVLGAGVTSVASGLGVL